MEPTKIKLLVCTIHGKNYRKCGFEFTPEELEVEVTPEQLKEMRKHAGRPLAEGGVLRIKELGAAKAEKADKPPPAKGEK